MVPRQSQSCSGLCTFMIEWVPLMSTLSVSPRVLPNGTQAISILFRFVYFYDYLGTIGEYLLPPPQKKSVFLEIVTLPNKVFVIAIGRNQNIHPTVTVK